MRALRGTCGIHPGGMHPDGEVIGFTQIDRWFRLCQGICANRIVSDGKFSALLMNPGDPMPPTGRCFRDHQRAWRMTIAAESGANRDVFLWVRTTSSERLLR